jgi:adenosine deaminase
MNRPAVAPQPQCVCPDLSLGEVCNPLAGQRCVSLLPKAHLHLHLTGGMRHPTLIDLAEQHGAHLPDRLLDSSPLHLDVDRDARSWHRFQHLYDLARRQVSDPGVVRRLLMEMCLDEAAEGSRWVELQVDPSGYVTTFGGLHEFLDLVLEAAADASTATGVGVGVVVAANRTKHPLQASALARLAVQYADGHRSGRAAAGRGVVQVVGFGLSNDERAGHASEFTQAFRIARRAGLVSVPHAGELAGADSVRSAVLDLGAARVGHGVRAAEDPSVLDLMSVRGVAAEVCPTSNVALGVADDLAAVPLTTLVDAGVPVALGADDPLLFGSRLAAQYRSARRDHHLSDTQLADLARHSLEASAAPDHVRIPAIQGIDAWLADLPVRGHHRGT